MVTEYINAPIIMSLCALILAISFPLTVLVDFIRSVVSNHAADNAINDLIRSGQLIFVQAVVENADYLDCSSSALVLYTSPRPFVFVAPDSPTLNSPSDSSPKFMIKEFEEVEGWLEWSTEGPRWQDGEAGRFILRVENPTSDEFDEIQAYFNIFLGEEFSEEHGLGEDGLSKVFDYVYDCQSWLLKYQGENPDTGIISWAHLKDILDHVVNTIPEWLPCHSAYGAEPTWEESMQPPPSTPCCEEERFMEELEDWDEIDLSQPTLDAFIPQDFEFTFVAPSQSASDVSQPPFEVPAPPTSQSDLPSDFDSDTSSSADDSIFSASPSSGSSNETDIFSPSFTPKSDRPSSTPSTDSDRPTPVPYSYIPSTKSARDGLILAWLNGHIGAATKGAEGYPLDFVSLSDETGEECIRSFWAARAGGV